MTPPNPHASTDQMSFDALPPDHQHPDLALDALPLNLLVGRSQRRTKVAVNLVLLKHRRQLLGLLDVVGGRCSLEVECRNFGHGSAEDLGQGGWSVKVHVEDAAAWRRVVDEGAKALEEGPIGR
ncbi:hypothetical protein Tdes44962_MAKER02246 [Teratosphaeria destructans]|uniref:Uncharacterized protein n=1 Tax=Teratosphaeria destructans TaxID=418781 RepID=A0A9W7SUF5_9PEZI|nr:hypothetical protein Tdes44962_MAKER02246 [Teratosphaeria destructans]